MAADIVPELYGKIKKEFNARISMNRSIQNIMKRIKDGTATSEDAHKYAEMIGEALSEVLLSNLGLENLPDETLYWNIADRTVRPMLKNNHKLVNNTASEIQKIIDKADGIGLNAITSAFPEYRVRDLIDKAVTENNPTKWFGEPVVNTTQSFYDDFVKANADFRYKAGMKPKVIRTLGSSGQRKSRGGRKYSIPCDWCIGLAGVYEYHSEPKDVYRRHEGCRCVVTFQNGKQRQNVWSKDIWEADEENLYKRKNHNAKPQKSYIDYNNEYDKIRINNGLLPLNLQFFAESDIKNQSSKSLKHGIMSLNKRIAEHEGHIKNPKNYISNWDEYDEVYKEGLVKHWEKEIKTFKTSIKEREKELKRRGISDE